MEIADSFRKAQGWTLVDLASELGLEKGSKGYVSKLLRGRVKPWPLRLALRMEKVSAGRVPAHALNPDAPLPAASSVN